MFKNKTKFLRLNQSGVAHLFYPILGLAVVAVIAGAGFYVYQQNKSGAGDKVLTIHLKQKGQADKSAACNPKSLVVKLETADKAAEIPTYGNGEFGKLKGKCALSQGKYSSTFVYKLTVPSTLTDYRYIIEDHNRARQGIYSHGYTAHLSVFDGCSIEGPPIHKAVKSAGIAVINIELFKPPLHKDGLANCQR